MDDGGADEEFTPPAGSRRPRTEFEIRCAEVALIRSPLAERYSEASRCAGDLSGAELDIYRARIRAATLKAMGALDDLLAATGAKDGE